MPLTIDYFKTHPLRVPKNSRDLTVGQMRMFEKQKTSTVKCYPAMGAFIHYGGVELADRITILKPSIEEDKLRKMAAYWNASCGATVRQLLFYVWHIINREMRHGDSAKYAKAFGKGDKFDPDALALTKAVMCGDNYEKRLDDPKFTNVKVGPFIDCIEWQYRKGGWGGSFGGVKWADIAVELQRYINGEASAMVASDRCWTLEHNSCSIFNKPAHFHTYDTNLHKVLDAQASTSVFTMTDKMSQYSHPFLEAFWSFHELAVNAIRSVDPEYFPGATGAVTSDGEKVKATGSSVGMKAGVSTTKLGPLALHTQSERVLS